MMKKNLIIPLLIMAGMAVKDGSYMEYYDNGNLQYSAIYKKNRLDGEWKSLYLSGMDCDSGRFIRDIPEGEWKGWYPDGRLRYTWHFSANKYFSLRNEMTSQPKYKLFKIAQLPFSEGITYLRTDYIFKQQAKTTFFMVRSRALESGSYEPSEMKSRVDNNTDTTTNFYLPPFPECLFHGSFITYYPDGRKREEGSYFNGLREGIWDEYKQNGMYSRGSYLHGKKSGQWRNYDSHGKVLSFTRYKNSGEAAESYVY
jgi:antitoxin component YwqK of YwqJK toxin-antitoxin module